MIDFFYFFFTYNLRYHHTYDAKKSKSITYQYYCSQRDCLAKKSKKHVDYNKHRDKQSMNRYSCEGCVKITFYQDFTNIKMQHYLHPTLSDILISPEIKNFILDNIDLLPREIYKQLIKQGLNINIRQKQIHFWWMELGKTRYKRDEDSFISAIKWLKEKEHEIVFQNNNPKAFGFLTNLWNILQNIQFKIYEIGVDATCK